MRRITLDINNWRGSPSIGALSLLERGIWLELVFLLTVASAEELTLQDEEIAESLKIDPEQWIKVKSRFISLRLLEEDFVDGVQSFSVERAVTALGRIRVRERTQSQPQKNGTRQLAKDKTPVQKCIDVWFSRRETTQWSRTEVDKLSEIAPAIDELKLMEHYYIAPIKPHEDYRRRDILTLLNNWTGELDRAVRFSEPERNQNVRMELNTKEALKKCQTTLERYEESLEGEPNEYQHITLKHLKDKIEHLKKELE